MGQRTGDRPVAGFALNVGSFMAASTGDALTKVAVASLALPQAMALRSLGLMLILVPVFILTARRGLAVFQTRRPWLHLTRTGLHFAASICGFLGLKQLPLTTFTTIVFVTPILIALVAVPMLGERLRRRQWLAILIGFAGCFVVVRPGGGDLPAMMIAFGSALTFALSLVLVRILTRTESLVTLVAWGNVPQCLAATAAALFDWRPIDGFLLLVVFGMSVTQAIGQWLSMAALKLAPAAIVAPAQYTQILWATVIGALFFREWPEPTIWIGAALIVAGGWLLMRSARAP